DPWVETPCRIIKSEIDDSHESQHYATLYEPVVHYTYNIDGKEYTGTKVKTLAPRSVNVKKALKITDQYPEAASALCYVDPKNPSEAVLKKPRSKAPLFTVWFPGVFVFAGVGLIFNAIRYRDKRQQATKD
ncbi:MAG: DUF3592 domain-containing protein, partial [Verrucomicrobiota bacterium]